MPIESKNPQNGAWRGRRLRSSGALRSMVRETNLRTTDLIYPLFVVSGSGVRDEIASMPNIYRQSVDNIVKECEKIAALGIQSVLLFGIPDTKDDIGSSAWDPNGPVQAATKAIKKALPDLIVVTDVCLCEYTSHGHCGVLGKGTVDNDQTLPLLAKTALSHVDAGSDIVAPSDMMDFRVAAIRQALDGADHGNTPIIAYSAKYASAFYGPFRDAAGSTPSFGDRRAYQMDSANVREAMLEVQQDIDEGADMVMVKPALAYLDVIRAVRDMTDLPVVAYNVSGEYSMVKAAAQAGWLDEIATAMEVVTGIKRAGADLIITYHAPEIAFALNKA
jgi:porphobilinogen synthase